MLLVAQGNGFEDVSKLQTDADLANVRKHPRFVEVVPSEEEVEGEYLMEVEGTETQPAIPTPTPAPAPAPAPTPQVGQQPISAESPDVLSLVGMFPDMSIDEAVCVLVLAKGSLSRAVNARLAGHYQRPGQTGKAPATTQRNSSTPIGSWPTAPPANRTSANSGAWAPPQPDVRRKH